MTWLAGKNSIPSLDIRAEKNRFELIQQSQSNAHLQCTPVGDKKVAQFRKENDIAKQKRLIKFLFDNYVTF